MTNIYVHRMRAPALLAGLATASFALSCSSGALAAPTAFQLPPIVQPPSSEHHPGKVVWVDLVTSDLAGAKHFYGGLFGWSFDDVATRGREYSIATLNGTPIAGIVQRAPRNGEHRQPAWLTFLSVRDVAATEKDIIARGGKALTAPREYPQRGTQAVCEDPQGAVFAVLQSSSGDPPDTLVPSGAWIWSSLHTRDPDTDAAFYQTIFGYEVFDASGDSSSGTEHVVLSTENYARASVNVQPSSGKRHPHWLNFVRVTSTPDTVAKARMLGARVLVEPHTDRHGGMIAVLADPAGAPFGVLEWTEADGEERAQ